MASSQDPKIDEGESFLEGKLLIALPGMTDERFAQTLEFINRLAHIAEAHEQRLDDFENRR